MHKKSHLIIQNKIQEIFLEIIDYYSFDGIYGYEYAEEKLSTNMYNFIISEMKLQKIFLGENLEKLDLKNSREILLGTTNFSLYVNNNPNKKLEDLGIKKIYKLQKIKDNKILYFTFYIDDREFDIENLEKLDKEKIEMFTEELIQNKLFKEI